MDKNEKDPQNDALDETVIGDEVLADPFTSGGSMSEVTDISGNRVSVDALASLADSLIQSGESPLKEEAGELSNFFNEMASGEKTAESPSQLPTVEVATPVSDEIPVALDAADAETLPEKSKAETEISAVEDGKQEGKEAGKSKSKFAQLILTNQKYVEWAGLGIIAAVLAVLGFTATLLIPTAVFLLAVVGVGYGIWLGRKTNTVYSILLGCAVMAVMVAVYCVWIELERYHYDVKARDAKIRVGMIDAGQLAPVNTTATAWPNVVRLTSNADV